jgi:hypothetical protein
MAKLGQGPELRNAMNQPMTARRAITWAELIVSAIIWGLYGWQVAKVVSGDTPLGDALGSAVPYLVLAVGASLIAGFGFWVMSRSPVLSRRTEPTSAFDATANYDGRGESAFLVETFRVLTGRYRHISPFADLREAEAWTSSRRASAITLACSLGLALAVMGAGSVGVRLWESTGGQVTLAVHLLALVILAALIAHRGLFLSRASRPAT